MDIHQEAVEMLKRLRERGVTVEQALNEMKGKQFGLIPVIKALRVVEGMSYADAVETIEGRGDYESF